MRRSRHIALLLRRLDAAPHDVLLLLKLGEFYQADGNKELAAATFSRVADAFEREGAWLKAAAILRQASRLDVQQTALHERLARLYRELGLLADARDEYAIVLRHYQSLGDAAKVAETMSALARLADDPTS